MPRAWSKIGVLLGLLTETGVSEAMLVLDGSKLDLDAEQGVQGAVNSGAGPQITVQSRFDSEAPLNRQFTPSGRTSQRR